VIDSFIIDDVDEKQRRALPLKAAGTADFLD